MTDPAQPRARYAVASTAISAGCLAMLAPILVVLSTIVAGGLLAKALHSAAPAAIPVLGLCGALAFVLSPATLTIEDAGVRLAWMGKIRWFPRDEIQGVAAYDRIVEVEERTDPSDRNSPLRLRQVRHVGVAITCGETIEIPMLRGSDRGRAQAELIAGRIREITGERDVTARLPPPPWGGSSPRGWPRNPRDGRSSRSRWSGPPGLRYLAATAP